ncbi:MAG TPA: protein phosphatase 2C domain-containing protein [Micromonosporaceae bacterium]|nr:protein phosphatase 2C domain-containing protein [Micromonosporaceae bacterium]
MVVIRSQGYPSRPAWRVAAADATGAVHVAKRMRYEDAWAVAPAYALHRDGSPVVVAVADGHGHARHFRSARGAELAVALAARRGVVAAIDLETATDIGHVELMLRNVLAPAIVDAWREDVHRDIAERPVTLPELAAAGLSAEPTAEDLLYGYGTTLLVAVAAGAWLGFLQLGDGDLIVVAPDGSVRHPVPYDPRLDGLRTTSLCQPDALESVRFGVVDVRAQPIGAVLLATDGFGNAHASNDWESTFGTDLANLSAQRGVEWVVEHLPEWVRECASANGSGDDATAVLLMATGTTWQRNHADDFRMGSGVLVPASEPPAGSSGPQHAAMSSPQHAAMTPAHHAATTPPNEAITSAVPPQSAPARHRRGP